MKRCPVALAVVGLAFQGMVWAEQDGPFTYEIRTNGAVITAYEMGYTNGVLHIPPQLGGHPVTTIGSLAFFSALFAEADIPESVTTIEGDAFQQCKFTTLNIPDTVSSIGPWAFQECTGLTNLHMGSGISTIERGVFFGCRGLRAATIPASVATIGEDAFGSCVSLRQVTISNGVATIQNRAFGGCVSLTSVTIPASVVTIGDGPFHSCGSLMAIQVDPGNPVYQSIDGALFSEDQGTLNQYPGGKAGPYVVPDGVEVIDHWAFMGCTNLTGLALPNSLTEINSRAYEGCLGLTSLVVPADVETIREAAFENCDNLTNIFFLGNAPLCENDIFGGMMTGLIPGTVYRIASASGWPDDQPGEDEYWNGLPVLVWQVSVLRVDPTSATIGPEADTLDFDVDNAGVGVMAFTATEAESWLEIVSGGSGTNSGTIIVSVTENTNHVPRTGTVMVTAPGAIGSPEDITVIQEAAPFQDGPFTYRVDHGEATIVDYDDAYTNGALAIPEQLGGCRVAGIARRAFAFKSMTRIDIPACVTNIEEEPFRGSDRMTEIRVSSSNAVYSHDAAGVLMNKIQTVLLAYPCGRAGPYVVPATVTHIEGGRPFGRSPYLTEVTIPADVVSITEAAFAYCPGLQAIVVSSSNQYYASSADGALFTKDMTELLQYPGGRPGTCVIPQGTLRIQAQAFGNSTLLTGVAIPPSVVRIDWGAFIGCPGLTSLTLPAAASQLQDYLFYNCIGLKRVYFLGDAPTFEDGEAGDVFGVADENPPSEAIVYRLPGTMGWSDTLAGRPVVVWDAQIASPGLAATGNGFNFSIGSSTNLPIAVEATTNLVTGSWLRLCATNVSGGTTTFVDTDAHNYLRRLYRIVGP